jgi:creatinine amidohydrolase
MTDGLIWAELTEGQVREAITPSTVGLLPVGAIEQHGPHLPTATDTIIAKHLVGQAVDRGGAIALPPLPIGVSYGHGTRLGGTLSVSPTQLAAQVVAVAEWAFHSGLRRLLIVNAHMGNAAALDVATDELRRRDDVARVAYRTWWRLSPALEQVMFADGQDTHANRAETSMIRAIAPHLVREDRVADADDPDRTGDLVFRYTAPVLSTNGVTGRPSEGTVEEGHALIAEATDRIAELVERGSREEPPLGA